MKERIADEVVEGLNEAGVRFASFLPDSWLRPIYSRLSQDSRFITIPVSNEGVGVGLCCGAWLGGMKAVMLMENTGVRMACDQLARLGMSVGLPCFMIIPYRGDIGDKLSYDHERHQLSRGHDHGRRSVRREPLISERVLPRTV